MPSALDGAPIVKRAVCACCAQPAIVASRFSGLLSSYMKAQHAQPVYLYGRHCAPVIELEACTLDAREPQEEEAKKS